MTTNRTERRLAAVIQPVCALRSFLVVSANYRRPHGLWGASAAALQNGLASPDSESLPLRFACQGLTLPFREPIHQDQIPGDSRRNPTTQLEVSSLILPAINSRRRLPATRGYVVLSHMV